MDTLIESNGRRFGRYVLLGHLADGGMASVYLAQLRGNNRFSKWAALKVVHRRHAGNDRFQKMFLTEARIVAQIDHPNVATVFDCGEDAGTYYLAMEYLTGQTLRKVSQQAVLRDRPVPLPLAARIIADAASGLHAAHELKGDDGESAGIVHRDVSPHNIFVLYSGGTKIMDFGIAFSNSRSDDEHTEIDELKGKIAYMSPEQLQRFPLDRRSDIFSLGIVLWELVAASRLFKRPTEGKAALAIIRDSVDAPSTMRHDCPPELDRIVLKALAKMPEDRYETAADLAADLEEYIISTGRAAGSPMLREYMHELFAEEIEEHSTSLRKASELVRQVEAELDLTATSSDEGPTVEIDVSTAQPRARAGPMTWLLAGVVIAASGVGAWTMFQSWMGPSAELDGEEGTVQVASPPVAEEAVAAAEPDTEHEGAVEPTAEPVIAVDTDRVIDPEPVRAIDAESARGAAAEPEPANEDTDARPRARGRWPQRRGNTPAVVAAEERVAPSPPQNASPTPTPTGPRPMTEFE